jgi:hypothetical protein
MSSQNIEAGITLGATSIGAGVGAVFGGLPGAAIGSQIGQTVGNTIGVFIRDDKPKNKFTLSMTKGDPYAGYRLGDVEKDYSFKKSITDGNNSLANTMNTVTTLGTEGLQVANSLTSSLTSQNDFKTVLKKPATVKLEGNESVIYKNNNRIVLK